MSGTPFGVRVEAVGVDGSIDPEFDATVVIDTITPPGGTDPLSRAATAIDGVVTINHVLSNAADGYRLSASGAGLSSGPSDPFNVTYSTIVVFPISGVPNQSSVAAGARSM